MTTMTKAQIEAQRVLENRRTAFTKRVRNLLGHQCSVRIDQKRINERFNSLTDGQRVDYGIHADALAAEIASAEPVGRALHTRKAAAVQSAREAAEARIHGMIEKLEAAGWDLHAAAPVPASIWDSGYKAARDRRAQFESVTRKADPHASYSRTGPRIVQMDTQAIERFIDFSEREAALQYDAFICKMVAKVGDVTSAELSGDHVWAHSILTVTLPSGEVQRWKTQQIVNYSVYGRPYLQWPSRVVK